MRSILIVRHNNPSVRLEAHTLDELVLSLRFVNPESPRPLEAEKLEDWFNEQHNTQTARSLLKAFWKVSPDYPGALTSSICCHIATTDTSTYYSIHIYW